MPKELTNLLPSERERMLARGYYLRLVVVGVIFVILLVVAAGILLIPTYLFLTNSIHANTLQLATVDAALASANEKEISARFAALSGAATTLTTHAKVPTASTIIGGVLAVPHGGVALTSFTYSPTNGKSPKTVSISGIAKTRDALRTYQLALQGASGVASAVLPVSAYAKDADISFNIILTFTS